MSGPSSDGRPSVSSEPSVTSSHTLNSRYSGAHEDNGEGSSSQRPSLPGSRGNSRGGFGVPEPIPKHAGSPLEAESIGEHDFAHRRHRSRRSGGFLLDSAFPTGPGARQQTRHSAYVEGLKGKHGSRHSHNYNGNGHTGEFQTGNGASSHSSPLSQQVVMADQHTAEDENRVDSATAQEQNEGLRVPKMRRSMREPSPTVPNRTSEHHEALRPTIDPNHLVHMALNLSESRRRNLTAGQLVTSQSPGSRRVTSVGIPQDGSFRDYSTGSSLRQYLNEQRRVSRNISPFGGRGSPSRHMSTSIQRSMSMSAQGPQIDPSPATLARRDKAQAYIELRIEYLRLLELLPPLKPDASAPGNFIVTANNVPGSPNAYLTRTPSYAGKKHELGRAYNPLQYIRNRKARARERRTLDHAPDEFLDIDQVRDWVDRVEQQSQRPGYRREDGVALPKFHEDHNKEGGPSKPSRPRMGWIFTSEELLADAHWLEQEDNKILIEDRHGRKIFPPKETEKQDFLQPRASKDYPDKRRRSWIEGLSGDVVTGDESDPTSERGRKRRLLPAFRAESPKHKKHGWRGSGPRSASTDTSDSDSDSQKHSKKHNKLLDTNNNTGPLGLHLKRIIEKEAMDGKPISPAIVSPDTPDKWGMGLQNISDNRNSVEENRIPNGSVKDAGPLDLKPPTKRRTDQTLTIDSKPEPRSSFEDLDSTAPNTPLHPKRLPHIGSDLSPPPSRGGSVRKSKKSRLDIFRSDESTKGHKHESESTTSEKKRNSRQISEEVADGTGLGTAILAAPSAVKSLLTHRKNDSVSSLNSPEHRKEYKDARELREPPSAVTRFFKGAKSGGSKMGEFIFRRDRPVEDSDTESTSDQSQNDSDADEGTGKLERKFRPTVGRSTTAATAGSVTSKKTGRYHLELPSFRSQSEQDKAYASDSQLVDDHITRQAIARVNSRSPRFDKLAPQRLDLRAISASSTPTGSRARSPESARDRMKRVLARPGGVGQGGLPMTSLAHPQLSSDALARQRSNSRPKLEKRHWSITDDNTSLPHSKVSVNVVTRADVARVRALFLCSGVKAREIARRAHEKRVDNPPEFLMRAAKASNAELFPVSKKEEHVLAARILVRSLESSTQALHASTNTFRDSTVKELTSMISSLKSRVESDLNPRVRDTGDEAVRITSEVSGNAPLAVKQVTDEIDKMIRMRRRRMRWVRRIGWILVEWTLLGIMWWLWLVVVVLGSVKRVFGVGWAIVRWLLWL